jgi:hypothetical protein
MQRVISGRQSGPVNSADSVPGCLQSLDQLTGVNTKPSGQLEQVVQADVPLTSFDLADESPVDLALVGQGFLAETKTVPVFANALAKGGGGR